MNKYLSPPSLIPREIIRKFPSKARTSAYRIQSTFVYPLFWYLRNHVRPRYQSGLKNGRKGREKISNKGYFLLPEHLLRHQSSLGGKNPQPSFSLAACPTSFLHQYHAARLIRFMAFWLSAIKAVYSALRRIRNARESM